MTAGRRIVLCAVLACVVNLAGCRSTPHEVTFDLSDCEPAPQTPVVRSHPDSPAAASAVRPAEAPDSVVPVAVSASPDLNEITTDHAVWLAQAENADTVDLLPPAFPTADESAGETDDAESDPSDEDAVGIGDDAARANSFTPPPLPESGAGSLTLDEVISSVYRAYPLLAAALTERRRAAGGQLSTWGAYDHNLTASSENQVAGFYENHRHEVSLGRNVYSGGSFFTKYRLGRGFIEPWFEERVTDDGGEFSFGFVRPLARDRDIDARRAALWRATYERQRVEPEIQRQLIEAVLAGSIAYWDWAATGHKLELSRSLLALSEERTRQFARREELGDIDPPLVTENERLVLARRLAVIDAERKLTQAAARLSLFYRDAAGEPVTPSSLSLPSLRPPTQPPLVPTADLPQALSGRPELAEIDAQRQKLQVTLAEARNGLRPRIDAVSLFKDNVGPIASPTGDKNEIVFEASAFFEVPLERRAAKGKIVETQAQLAGLTAKRRLAADRVLVELNLAAQAYNAALGRITAAEESVDLARELVRMERRRFDLGDASLLEVTFREQQLAQSAEALITARLDVHIAAARYRAALSVDRLPSEPCP